MINVRKINQIMPYLWGMVVVSNGIFFLYNSTDVFQGILLGFAIGMFFGSIFMNKAQKLIDLQQLLIKRMLVSMKKMNERVFKMLEILERK